MSDERISSRLAAMLHTLKPKTKQPTSATVLNNWIAQAEGRLGQEAKGGRLVSHHAAATLRSVAPRSAKPLRALGPMSG